MSERVNETDPTNTSRLNFKSCLNSATTLPTCLHLDLQASRFTMPSTDHNDHRCILSPAEIWISEDNLGRLGFRAQGSDWGSFSRAWGVTVDDINPALP